MLSYELAKKLKDAGYSQGGTDLDWWIEPSEQKVRWHEGSNNSVRLPTLSELIDFVDENDRMGILEKEYVEKALLKLSKGKEE